MKFAITFFFLSLSAFASKPVQPNFFAVDTNTLDIRPDKEVAMKHYENRIKKKEKDRRPAPKDQMSAAERTASSSMNSGM